MEVRCSNSPDVHGLDFDLQSCICSTRHFLTQLHNWQEDLHPDPVVFNAWISLVSHMGCCLKVPPGKEQELKERRAEEQRWAGVCAWTLRKLKLAHVLWRAGNFFRRFCCLHQGSGREAKREAKEREAKEGDVKETGTVLLIPDMHPWYDGFIVLVISLGTWLICLHGEWHDPTWDQMWSSKNESCPIFPIGSGFSSPETQMHNNFMWAKDTSDTSPTSLALFACSNSMKLVI